MKNSAEFCINARFENFVTIFSARARRGHQPMSNFDPPPRSEILLREIVARNSFISDDQCSFSPEYQVLYGAGIAAVCELLYSALFGRSKYRLFT